MTPWNPFTPKSTACYDISGGEAYSAMAYTPDARKGERFQVLFDQLTDMLTAYDGENIMCLIQSVSAISGLPSRSVLDVVHDSTMLVGEGDTDREAWTMVAKAIAYDLAETAVFGSSGDPTRIHYKD